MARPQNAERIEFVTDIKTLRRAPWNTGQASEEDLLGIMRSIVEHGFADPLIVRRKDMLILGGHQRLTAVEKLLALPFTFKGDGGKNVTVRWKLPPKGLPVVYYDDITDRRAKLMNMALRRATGERDEEKVTALLHELHTDGVDVFALGATAFTQAEIADYLDEATRTAADTGAGPGKAKQTPKITADFTTAETRDAVKAAITNAARGDEPAGDTLARMLGIRVRRSRAA